MRYVGEWARPSFGPCCCTQKRSRPVRPAMQGSLCCPPVLPFLFGVPPQPMDVPAFIQSLPEAAQACMLQQWFLAQDFSTAERWVGAGLQPAGAGQGQAAGSHQRWQALAGHG